MRQVDEKSELGLFVSQLETLLRHLESYVPFTKQDIPMPVRQVVEMHPLAKEYSDINGLTIAQIFTSLIGQALSDAARLAKEPERERQEEKLLFVWARDLAPIIYINLERAKSEEETIEWLLEWVDQKERWPHAFTSVEQIERTVNRLKFLPRPTRNLRYRKGIDWLGEHLLLVAKQQEPTLDRQVARCAYQELLVLRHSSVRVPDCPTVNLKDLYVETPLRPLRRESDQDDDTMLLYEVVRGLTTGALSRVVIVGQPGQGKTTLLRWLALMSMDLGDWIPLPLDLSQWEGEGEESPFWIGWRQLSRGTRLSVWQKGMARRWLLEECSRNRVVFLIDGWDHASEEARSVVEQVPQYVLTTRYMDFAENRSVIVFYLAQWGERDARAYVQRCQQLGWVTSEQAERILRSAPLSEAVPMMLTLAVQAIRAGDEIGGASWPRLMEAIWAKSSAVASRGADRAVLTDLALEAYLETDPPRQWFLASRVGQEVIKWGESAGVLVPVDSLRVEFRFAHPLWMAFLAAKAIVRSGEIETLACRYAGYARWADVWVALGDILGRCNRWREFSLLLQAIISGRVTWEDAWRWVTASRLLMIAGELGQTAFTPLVEQVANALVTLHGLVGVSRLEWQETIRAVFAGWTHPSVVNALAKRAKFGDYDALVLLGQVGTEEAANALLDMAEQCKERDVRFIARALGETGRGVVFPVLKDWASSKDDVTALHALLALGRLGTIEALRYLFQVYRGRELVERRGYWRHKYVENALNRLRPTASPKELRKLLREQLRLKQPELVLFRALLRAIGMTDDGRAGDYLIRLLSRSDLAVRYKAVYKEAIAEALGQIGSPKDRRRLVGVIQNRSRVDDKAVWLQRWAVRALAQFPDLTAWNELLALLDDPEVPAHVWHEVIYELQRSELAMPVIMHMLADPHRPEEDRLLALKLLEASGRVPTWGLEQVMDYLSHSDPEVRRRATAILRRSGCAEAICALERQVEQEQEREVKGVMLEAIRDLESIGENGPSTH